MCKVQFPSSTLFLASFALLWLNACSTTNAPIERPTDTSETATEPSVAEAASVSEQTTIEAKVIDPAFVLTRGKDTGLNRFVLTGVGNYKIVALASKAKAVYLFNASSGQFEEEVRPKDKLIEPTNISAESTQIFVFSPKLQSAHVWRSKYALSYLGILKFDQPTSPLDLVSLSFVDGTKRIVAVEDVGQKRELVLTDLNVKKPGHLSQVTLESFTFKALKRLPLPFGKNGEKTSISFNDATSTLLVSSGSILKELSTDGEIIDSALPSFDKPIFGTQFRHCGGGIGSMLLVGTSTEQGALIEIFEPSDNKKLAAFEVKGLRNPSQMTFLKAPMEYFPAGALYFAADGDSIFGVDWATVAKATGVREQCF
jgi:hypothetical protein